MVEIEEANALQRQLAASELEERMAMATMRRQQQQEMVVEEMRKTQRQQEEARVQALARSLWQGAMAEGRVVQADVRMRDAARVREAAMTRILMSPTIVRSMCRAKLLVPIWRKKSARFC